MQTVVIYGFAPDDPQFLAPLAHKLIIIYEADVLNARNFHPEATCSVIFSNSVVTSDLLGPKLKLIITRATGIDNIKCQNVLQERHIKLVRNATYATQSVAEYSLFAITRYLSEAYFEANGAVDRQELAEKTVGLIGYGAIGRKLTGFLA